MAFNPNAELLVKLRAAGVKLMVCGQSALSQHYDLHALARAAQINLSATVTFINLETAGYVKVENRLAGRIGSIPEKRLLQKTAFASALGAELVTCLRPVHDRSSSVTSPA